MSALSNAASEAKRLAVLLDEGEVGLVSWHMAVQNVWLRLVEAMQFLPSAEDA